MSTKKPSFHPEDANRSYLVHEFLTLHREFIQSQNIPSAKKLHSFLSDKKKVQLFIDYAIYNPHPTTHDSIQDDIEQTLITLEGWMEDKTSIEHTIHFLNTLKAWLTEEAL